jgi:hypothetical protein
MLHKLKLRKYNNRLGLKIFKLQLCILKLKLTKVDYLLCDSNVVDYEEALAFSMLNLKVAKTFLTILVEQLFRMKSWASLYFEPL